MGSGRRRRAPAHRHSRGVVRPGVLGDDLRAPKESTVKESREMLAALDPEARFAIAATFLQDIQNALEALGDALDDDEERAAFVTGAWLSKFASNPSALTAFAMIAFEFDLFADALRADD